MYAIAQIKVTPNPETGKNDFSPDIVGGYMKCVYAPTLADQSGNRLARNWCILWLTDPINTTGNYFPIEESLSNSLWGDLNNGRKNQILNVLSANGIDSSFIIDQMTILEILNQIVKELQPTKNLDIA